MEQGRGQIGGGKQESDDKLQKANGFNGLKDVRMKYGNLSFKNATIWESKANNLYFEERGITEQMYASKLFLVS